MRRFRALAVVVALGLASIPGPLVADDPDHDLGQIADRMSSVADMIDEVAASRSLLAAEILASNQRIEDLRIDLVEAQAARADVEARSEIQSRRLEDARSDLRRSYMHLSETRAAIAGGRVAAINSARLAYVNGGREYAVLSLAGDQITAVALGLEYLERVSAANGEVLATLAVLERREAAETLAISETENRMARDLDAMEELEVGLQAVYADVVARQVELEAEVALQTLLIEQLDVEIAHFEDELDELQAEQARIKRRIAAEQAEAAARLAAPALVSPSGFVRPVPGVITSGYGARYHPILGYYRLHTGVDMAAGYGRQIKAASDGVVILADVWGGYGRTVVIDHGGGVSTLYAHQSSLSVSYGERITAGTVIGKVGTSGLSTGAHLHFEVRVGGEPVDPAPYLNG